MGGLRRKGKPVPTRRGPKPEVEDREVLCLAKLQNLPGFESDHEFYLALRRVNLWFESDGTMGLLFPRRPWRQNRADRLARIAYLPQLCYSAKRRFAAKHEPGNPHDILEAYLHFRLVA